MNKMITEIKACDTQTIAIARNRQSGAKATPQSRRKAYLKQQLKNPGKYKIVIRYHYTPPQDRTSQSFFATKIFDSMWNEPSIHTKETTLTSRTLIILLFSSLQDNILHEGTKELLMLKWWNQDVNTIKPTSLFGSDCTMDEDRIKWFILLFHRGIAVLEKTASARTSVLLVTEQAAQKVTISGHHLAEKLAHLFSLSPAPLDSLLNLFI